MRARRLLHVADPEDPGVAIAIVFQVKNIIRDIARRCLGITGAKKNNHLMTNEVGGIDGAAANLRQLNVGNPVPRICCAQLIGPSKPEDDLLRELIAAHP